MLYAVGEITLVVIGILIALQINNWNEWRKDRVKERDVLQELEDNLQRNLLGLEQGLSSIRDLNKSSIYVTQILSENSTYADSMDTHFFNALLRGDLRVLIATDGYESYKNAGFDILRSKELKKRLIHLFEVNYHALGQWRNYISGTTNFDLNYWASNFIQYERGFKPKNYQELQSDNQNQSIFYSVLRTRRVLENLVDLSYYETDEILQLIKEELGED